MREQVKFLKALADGTRMQLVQCLLDGERCVCTLVPAVGKAQPTVSQHLRILEEAGVLASRRDGVRVLYRINSDRVVPILEILEIPKIDVPTTDAEETCQKIRS